MTAADFTWTFELADASLTFGADTDLEILKVDGLDGWDARSSSRPIPRGHGAVGGAHFLPGLEPVFRCEAMGTQERVEELRELWAAGLPISTDDVGTLTFKRPGTDERFHHARVLARHWPTDARNIGVKAEPTVAFEVNDPRAYATTLKQEKLTPYVEGGGLDFGVDFGVDFTVTGNDGSADNGGNADSPPLIRFFGPDSGTCTGVQLLNRTTGVEIDVQTNITAGQILTFDVRAFVAATGGRVVDLDGANRYGSWQHTREALLIASGSNLLRFTADGATDGMECVVSFRDCWL